MGPMRRPLRNCLTTGSSLVSSTSRGPNITRCLRNSMPMLSGTVRAMLMLCVTIRIVQSICALMSISSWRQVGGTHRVQTRVGLVAEDDLRVEHQRAGQAGALAHTAGDLAGELVLVAGQADQLELLHDDVADLAFLLLGVLTQGESGVVVEAHRAEQRAVLEHDAEQRADLVELLGRALDDVGAVDDDLAALGAQQADQRLQEHRLTGTGRAEQHADLTGGDLDRDVFPDSLGPEGLGQSLNLNSDAHARSFRQVLAPPHASRLWLESL